MILADGMGTPLVPMTESATPNEVTLIEPMLGQLRISKVGRGRPKTKWHRLIYDKGADSDPVAFVDGAKPVALVTAAQLAMILEGIEPVVVKQRKRFTLKNQAPNES